ncbi:MAG: hypothetical protein HUU21_10780, partial [Polyangiaceae bacterium]|nr:hypothetical protein [Polyangiaceae bacterium]
SSNPAAGVEGAPPENGIMGPVAADKAHPPGAPPKVELLSEGSEPRVALAPKLAAGAEQKVTLSVQRSQMPLSIDLAIAFKVDKAKDDKKKKPDAAKGEAAPEGPAGALAVVGKIEGASVTAQVEVPEDLTKAVTALKGSQIRFLMTPDGAATHFTRELSKGADRVLDAELETIIEAFSTILAPMPQKPVGVGAYWMVTDRGRSLGAEMVRYRVFRVLSAGAEGAKLAVELRQYSTAPSLNVPDQQGGQMALQLDKFDSQGKGEVNWAGGFLPSASDMQSQVQALAIPPGQPNRRAQIQAGARLKMKSN